MFKMYPYVNRLPRLPPFFCRKVGFSSCASLTQLERRHIREEATIDHLVRAVFEKTKGTVHAPFTLSGLSVEEQIRKEWHPGMGGLALF